MENLTEKQAFVAMMLFLDDYYQRTKSDEIGVLLGGLQIVGDGMPADPAAWEDWIKCVQTAVSHTPNTIQESIPL